MKSWRLEELIAGGESLTVEFKAQVNDRELTRAAACMANGSGGVLLVGIDDAGMVVGSPPRHGTTTLPDRVAALIQNTTEPALPVAVVVEKVHGLPVLRIDIPRGDPGPAGPRTVCSPSA